MIEHLTLLKLGVLLAGDISVGIFTRSIFSTYINVEETILSPIESSISTILFEQPFLIVVVESIVSWRKLRTNEYIRRITTTEPSSVVSNRLTIFSKWVASLKDESTALEALLTDL